eukprot:5926381-Pleurochrysis_carterae.AAC.1
MLVLRPKVPSVNAEDGLAQQAQDALAHDGIGQDLAHILVTLIVHVTIAMRFWDHPLVDLVV